MNKRAATATIAALALAAGGFSPTFAADGKKKHKHKPLKGTFSYTDVTPDPTVVADSNASTHCHGNLPSAPTDVNSHSLKVKGAGTLTVIGHNALDWAMEVRDRHGNVLTGSDSGSPTAAEGATVPLPRKGVYEIVYCSAEGEPTITASYTFIYK